MNNNIENKLIKGCLKGDRQAQNDTYKLYSDILYAICMRYCANSSNAKDCLHDSFVKIFLNIKSYKFQGPFEAWIKRITVNTCLQFLKNSKKTTFLSIEDSNLYSIYNETDDLTFLEQIHYDEIFKALQKLTPQYRVVFNLFYLEEYSHKEIAMQLNINEGTSKSNLFKAKKMLRKILITNNLDSYERESN